MIGRHSPPNQDNSAAIARTRFPDAGSKWSPAARRYHGKTVRYASRAPLPFFDPKTQRYAQLRRADSFFRQRYGADNSQNTPRHSGAVAH